MIPLTSPGNPTARSTADLNALRDQQLRKLRAGLGDVMRSNAFWRERLHDMRGWDDFARLPLTDKAELLSDQAAHPPFGTNLTYPLDRFVRLHQTSGSSGDQPLRWLDTSESWEWWLQIWADHVYRAAGVKAGDRVFFAFSFGPFVGFWSAFGGAQRLGALSISGGAMTTEQRLRTMLELNATVLLSTPTYALRLADVANELSLDLRGSGVRVTIHAGEPGASIPATRAAIEEAYGATCFDHTGMTELGPTGFSCSQRDGIHLIESEFIFEVLDQAGRPADEGELVATNLGRWGMPLIRYRTGDRVRVSREPCGCGSPFIKVIGGIQGRVDDMFTVRGVNLYPSQVEDIVRRHPEVAEFVLERRRERQMDEVSLLIEPAGEDFSTERLEADLRQALGVRLDCRVVERGTLPRSELKAKRIRQA
ncbi:MAG TPA: phenylacetate--CoA ligase family protein [Candidatus Dormibacteraeota bacterium]|jgi:phenylacetate-CoA ligase|nr:phenylacetate--CoA ligase family protein [Candidatus Dormibacteraeota bacterium]